MAATIEGRIGPGAFHFVSDGAALPSRGCKHSGEALEMGECVETYKEIKAVTVAR